MLGSLGDATGMQDTSTEALNQQASSLLSLSFDPSQLSSGGEFSALSLVGGIASGSAGIGLGSGTADTIAGTLSKLLASSLLKSNASSSSISSLASTATPSAEILTSNARRRRLSTPTGAPTAVMQADSAVLMAVSDAIADLSSAQLLGAVPGEVAAIISTDNVIMASSRSFTSNAADDDAVMATPDNAGGSAPAVSLGDAASGDGSDGGTLAVRFQQWSTNVYADADESATETMSPLISLGVSVEGTFDDDVDDGGRRARDRRHERGLRRRRTARARWRRRLLEEGGGNDDIAGSPMLFVMQNMKPIDYDIGSEKVYVNLTCPSGYIGRMEATCPRTNATVAVNCSGM